MSGQMGGTQPWEEPLATDAALAPTLLQGTNATDPITSLHLILAKRLKSSKRRLARHPDAEGRLLLSLRLHFRPVCVLDDFCTGCRDIS